MQPPRSLWVSFPLGRPLGKPGDADFQHQVIGAALALVDHRSGPVLADFPLDAPVLDGGGAPACPVFFAKPDEMATTWEDRLRDDLASVMPWYEISQRRRGRSLVGVSEQSPQANILAIGRLLDDQQLPLDRLTWFKHAVEDLKVLYLEAFTAQPGDYNHEQIQQMFWQQSQFGAALIQFYHRFRQASDQRVALIARMIVPREAVGEDAGGPAGRPTDGPGPQRV